MSDHAAMRVDAVCSRSIEQRARVTRMSAILAGEHKCNVAIAAADHESDGIDHARLAVPRRDPAGDQHTRACGRTRQALRKAAMRSSLTAAGLNLAMSTLFGMTRTRSAAIW